MTWEFTEQVHHNNKTLKYKETDKMAALKIPDDIKQQADKIVADFNRNVFKDSNYYYKTRCKGKFLYLDRYEYGTESKVCRLQYTGTIDQWEFAIYKYSNDRYDPEEWMFPGSGLVDGTIEGAMKAGMEAYS
jgi:hypothetical protein